MHFEILTAVPEVVEGYLAGSILGRAREAGTVSFGVTPIYQFGEGKHRSIDDAPYGGGSGMVMKAGPVVAAIEHSRSAAPPGERLLVLLTHPGGRLLDREMAHDLAGGYDRVVLVCGRYEGVDARVEAYVDGLVSLGDFVLTGGELVALAVVDSVARLLPGVLGNDASSEEESFEGPLLEYPQYTRPRSFEGSEVPDVLLSGDHARIDRWRLQEAVSRTLRLRPSRVKNRAALPAAIKECLEVLDGDPKEE
ncbi:MAG: tRNA (guanosine(37)-N1)-methyltransferase TrmD [Myxococcota bacterium]|nr:tRNA (guanosine(37)-N1)-methyltransferase TrmD [Myxococcota bacterium]